MNRGKIHRLFARPWGVLQCREFARKEVPLARAPLWPNADHLFETVPTSNFSPTGTKHLPLQSRHDGGTSGAATSVSLCGGDVGTLMKTNRTTTKNGNRFISA